MLLRQEVWCCGPWAWLEGKLHSDEGGQWLSRGHSGGLCPLWPLHAHKQQQDFFLPLPEKLLSIQGSNTDASERVSEWVEKKWQIYAVFQVTDADTRSSRRGHRVPSPTCGLCRVSFLPKRTVWKGREGTSQWRDSTNRQGVEATSIVIGPVENTGQEWLSPLGSSSPNPQPSLAVRKYQKITGSWGILQNTWPGKTAEVIKKKGSRRCCHMRVKCDVVPWEGTLGRGRALGDSSGNLNEVWALVNSNVLILVINGNKRTSLLYGTNNGNRVSGVWELSVLSSVFLYI